MDKQEQMESAKVALSRKRDHPNRLNEPHIGQSRMENSSGNSSDAEVNHLQSYSASSNRFEEPSSKRAQIGSLISGNISDAEENHLRDDFALLVKKESKDVNDSYIKKIYSSLQEKIAESLGKTDINVLKFYIGNIFEPENISSLLVDDNVLEIFQKLKRHHLWNYNNITMLHRIAKRFTNDEEIIKAIENYNECLENYKKNTKLWQKINCSNLKKNNEDDEDEEEQDIHKERDPGHCKMAIRKKFAVTILQECEQEKKINDIQYSIKHLDYIFKSIQTKFKLPLEAVLYNIAPGSMEVTWYIPSISAQLVLDGLQNTEDFFNKIRISTVYLEDVQIYTESFGAVDMKELNGLRLLLAVQDKNVKQVNSLIEDCLDLLNKPEKMRDQKSLLMTAAFGGSIDIITSFVNHGASIDQQDANGWTALSYACISEHKEACNFLMHHGANLTFKSHAGTNIFDLLRKYNLSEMETLFIEKLEQEMICAVKDGELEFVQKALAMGADVDAMDDNDDWNALCWASHMGYLEVVQCLLAHGSGPNTRCGESMWSPLILSSRNGYHEVVECLLDHGAFVDQETLGGWTSLRFASLYGHVEVGRVLIRHNATVNCLDREHGYTPLNQASQDGHADFVSMMISEVPDLDLNFSTAKGEGWTSLMLACKNNHVDTVRELLLAGCNPNHQKDDRVTAIHIASYAGFDKVVSSLMLHGADVDIADEWGVTSLMFAVKEGHLSVVQALMKSDRLNVNVQENETKFSAPFFAVQCKHLDILQELMKSGKVNCEIKDLKEKTLWDLIQRSNFDDARHLFAETYQDEMKKMMSMVSEKPVTEDTSTIEGPVLTHKVMMERMDESNLYITRMMKRIDERMNTGGKAA